MGPVDQLSPAVPPGSVTGAARWFGALFFSISMPGRGSPNPASSSMCRCMLLRDVTSLMDALPVRRGGEVASCRGAVIVPAGPPTSGAHRQKSVPRPPPLGDEQWPAREACGRRHGRRLPRRTANVARGAPCSESVNEVRSLSRNTYVWTVGCIATLESTVGCQLK